MRHILVIIFDFIVYNKETVLSFKEFDVKSSIYEHIQT